MGNCATRCRDKNNAKKKYKTPQQVMENDDGLFVGSDGGQGTQNKSSGEITRSTSVPSQPEIQIAENKKPKQQGRPEQSPNDKKAYKKKKKRKDSLDTSDSSTDSDDDSSTDSDDSKFKGYQKNSNRAYANKKGETTYVSKKTVVHGQYMEIGRGATTVQLTFNEGSAMQHTKTQEENTKYEPYTDKSKREYLAKRSVHTNAPGDLVFLPEASTGRLKGIDVGNLEQAWQKSVCKIVYPGGSGTGFRVGRGGRNLILTANHVLDCIVYRDQSIFGDSRANRELQLGKEDVWCVFNYILDDYYPDERDKFHFKPVIHYFNLETDVAILELKGNEFGSPMPPPFTKFGMPGLTEPFYLIGHPDGGKKKSCLSENIINMTSPETANHINKVRRWCGERGLTCEVKNKFHWLDNPARWLFHVHHNFTAGASGSPGLVIKPPHVYVVTVLLRGYPYWFYDPPIDDRVKATLPDGYRVEQGANMMSVANNMQCHNQPLFNEIFNV